MKKERIQEIYLEIGKRNFMKIRMVHIKKNWHFARISMTERRRILSMQGDLSQLKGIRICKNCGARFDEKYTFSFCGNCGAKLDAEE